MSAKKWISTGEGYRHKQKESLERTAIRDFTHSIKGIIDKVYHPSDENPQGFEYLNTNYIRVTITPSSTVIDYSDEVKDWVFPLQMDPQLFSFVNGSDGVKGKPCTLKFLLPNIRATGQVFLESTNDFNSKNSKDETKYNKYLTQKMGNLTRALLG